MIWVSCVTGWGIVGFWYMPTLRTQAYFRKKKGRGTPTGPVRDALGADKVRSPAIIHVAVVEVGVGIKSGP
jgi:hypothetical protein